MKSGRWAAIGAVSLALGVTCGAFAAHGLKGRLSEQALGWWQTASQYQLIHGLGLFAVAWVATWSVHRRLTAAAGWLLLAGLVLFSGSLYAMALTDVRGLGAVTPLGGTAWIVGWVCVALASRGR